MTCADGRNETGPAEGSVEESQLFFYSRSPSEGYHASVFYAVSVLVGLK